MIVVKQINVQFGGVKGLTDLSVIIDAPVTGLIGPNGAGKTTLLNVFSGFVRPVSGSIDMDGVALLSIPAHKRARAGVRRTFQTEQTVDTLTVEDNVAAAVDHLDVGSISRTRQIKDALAFVGLTGLAKSLAADLNACERRLLEISRAIIAGPKLVMMDEPGAGLAAGEAERLRAIIAAIPNHCGARVLLVDHDVALISAVCQNAIVLDFGRLVADGPTESVLANPKVRAAYLGVEEGGDA